jgi:hypothetical protein
MANQEPAAENIVRAGRISREDDRSMRQFGHLSLFPAPPYAFFHGFSLADFRMFFRGVGA